MPYLGKLDHTVLDSAGNALSGVSVEVRKPGATVNDAQTPSSGEEIVVFSAGGALVGDTMVIETGSTEYDVDTVSSDDLGVHLSGFSGSLSLSDLDRLSITSNLPELWKDPVGNDAKSNPLTSDSNGRVTAYLEAGVYDLLISGGSASTTLIKDHPVYGDLRASRLEHTSSSVAHTLRSKKALVPRDGAKIVNAELGTTEKWFIDIDGGSTFAEKVTITTGGMQITAGGQTITAGGQTITAGGQTITAGGQTITAGGQTISADGAAITGGVTISTGGLTVSAGTVSLPSEQIDTSEIAVNAVWHLRTDISYSAANTSPQAATWEGIANLSSSFTANNTGSLVMATLTGAASINDAAGSGLDVRIYDSAADEVLCSTRVRGDAGTEKNNICMTGYITGQSSYTLVPQYALLAGSDDASLLAASHSVDFTVIEFKVN